MSDLNRRDLLVNTSVALATIAALGIARSAKAFPSRPDDIVIPWLDQPPSLDDPSVRNQLVWEDLDAWITPTEKFFSVHHFNEPVIDPATWRLKVDGLVRHPLSLSLDDIKSLARTELTFTLEGAGNHGTPGYTGGIGTARWLGAPLDRILNEADTAPDGLEVVFWGADLGDITLRDATRDVTMTQHFARSLSLADAWHNANILAYEMNGEPLSVAHGAPLRFLATERYGIASVKWLKRIEVRDRRLMNQFMARDYVTIREEDREGETYWTETSVGRVRLKPLPAKVTRSAAGYRIMGAAWGAYIRAVEVQIDDGPWQKATIEPGEGQHEAWGFRFYDWPDPVPGEHTITSRVTDRRGNLQPAMDDPQIAKKHTSGKATDRSPGG